MTTLILKIRYFANSMLSVSVSHCPEKSLHLRLIFLSMRIDKSHRKRMRGELWLSLCVSPIDMMLSNDYWISHYQPWWKNQSHNAVKNVLHSVYTISVCTELTRGQSQLSVGVTRPKTTSCFCTQALSPWTCCSSVF